MLYEVITLAATIIETNTSTNDTIATTICDNEVTAKILKTLPLVIFHDFFIEKLGLRIAAAGKTNITLC